MCQYLDKQEFFKQNIGAKYGVLDALTREFCNYILGIYVQTPAYQLDGLVRRELEKIEDTTALTAFIFNRMNVFNVNLIQLQNQITQKEAQLQKAKEYLIKQQNIIKDLEQELTQKN